MHTLFVLFHHVIVYIFSLGQRDPLDRYIYFHPDHEWYGAKGWRIGQKQHLSGENEGTY